MNSGGTETGTGRQTKRPPDNNEGQLMYIRCAACGGWLDAKPGGMHVVSHSLCPECLELELRRLEQPVDTQQP